MSVNPREYDALADFTCGGEHGYEWETVCDQLVRKLASTGGPDGIVVRVAEDRSTDELIGVSCFRWLPPITRFPGQPPGEDAACIPVLAIAQQYRKAKLPDGEAPIGAFLLEDTLGSIQETWSDAMPPVWAIVHRENRRCREMLYPRGFEVYEPDDGDNDMWFRPRGLSPDWRRNS
jgi:hypothetical protein